MNLERLALQIRKDSIEMIYRAGSGHPGGSLSCADILAYLFGKEMKGTFKDPNRDRFILSKGHAAPALYSVLAYTGRLANNFKLDQLRKLGSPLQGHPSVVHIPEVETSTGSLGQGLSVGVGMALGLKMKASAARVIVLIGDGEFQEGIVMEAMLFAGHYKLDNLHVIMDYNKYQSDDLVENIMGIEPILTRLYHLGWSPSLVDGHIMIADSEVGIKGLSSAFRESGHVLGRPRFILAHTVKGKGVSFMEGPDHHGSLTLSEDEYARAMEELK